MPLASERLQEIRENPELQGPDKAKLSGIEHLISGGVKYTLGLYSQFDENIGENIYHYRIQAEKDKKIIPIIDFQPIQEFIKQRHPNIVFIQVFPAEQDTIDEGYTYHFFGYLPFSRTAKSIISGVSSSLTWHGKFSDTVGFSHIQAEKLNAGLGHTAVFQLMSGVPADIARFLEPVHVFTPPKNIILPNLKSLRTKSI